MEIKFIGVPGEHHDSIHMYGVELPLGEFIKVSEPFAIHKLKSHPHFESRGAADVTDVDVIVTTDKTGTLSELLAKPVAHITSLLPEYTDEQLVTLVAAEVAGANRKGLLHAVEAEQTTRKAG